MFRLFTFHFKMLKKILCVILVLYLVNCSETSRPEIIKGKNLIIATLAYPIALTEVRNSSGYIISVDGISPLMLDWLSFRYGFSHSILQINKTSIEGSGLVLGYASYLANGKCDVIIGGMATLQTRLAFMEFTQGFLYASNVGLMIPMPDSNNNVAAVAKPFQITVWIGIIIAVSCVLAAFYFSLRFSQKLSDKRNRKNPAQIGTENPPLKKSSGFFTFSLLYTFEVLLSQGSYCPEKRLVIRLIATAWCLAAFVLVTSYNSLLVSYLVSPNAEPLIQSIKDLSNISKIHLVVNAGNGFDVSLSKGTFPVGNIYNDLKNKLRDYPNSRCPKTEHCVNLVKSGNHVYINSVMAILDAMKKDFQSTGKCNLAIAKEKEYASPWSWALAKKSPYMEYFNQGILEMRDFGLLDIWAKWYQPDVRKCLDNADKIMQLKTPSRRTDSSRLSLKNLTGAFVVLIFGYLVSFLVFLVERILSYSKQ